MVGARGLMVPAHPLGRGRRLEGLVGGFCGQEFEGAAVAVVEGGG